MITLLQVFLKFVSPRIHARIHTHPRIKCIPTRYNMVFLSYRRIILCFVRENCCKFSLLKHHSSKASVFFFFFKISNNHFQLLRTIFNKYLIILHFLCKYIIYLITKGIIYRNMKTIVFIVLLYIY